MLFVLYGCALLHLAAAWLKITAPTARANGDIGGLDGQNQNPCSGAGGGNGRVYVDYYYENTAEISYTISFKQFDSASVELSWIGGNSPNFATQSRTILATTPIPEPADQTYTGLVYISMGTDDGVAPPADATSSSNGTLQVKLTPVGSNPFFQCIDMQFGPPQTVVMPNNPVNSIQTTTAPNSAPSIQSPGSFCLFVLLPLFCALAALAPHT